jgi:hypothetical protein
VKFIFTFRQSKHIFYTIFQFMSCSHFTKAPVSLLGLLYTTNTEQRSSQHSVKLQRYTATRVYKNRSSSLLPSVSRRQQYDILAIMLQIHRSAGSTRGTTLTKQAALYLACYLYLYCPYRCVISEFSSMCIQSNTTRQILL